MPKENKVNDIARCCEDERIPKFLEYGTTCCEFSHSRRRCMVATDADCTPGKCIPRAPNFCVMLKLLLSHWQSHRQKPPTVLIDDPLYATSLGTSSRRLNEIYAVSRVNPLYKDTDSEGNSRGASTGVNSQNDSEDTDGSKLGGRKKKISDKTEDNVKSEVDDKNSGGIEKSRLSTEHESTAEISPKTNASESDSNTSSVSVEVHASAEEAEDNPKESSDVKTRKSVEEPSKTSVKTIPKEVEAMGPNAEKHNVEVKEFRSLGSPNLMKKEKSSALTSPKTIPPDSVTRTDSSDSETHTNSAAVPLSDNAKTVSSSTKDQEVPYEASKTTPKQVVQSATNTNGGDKPVPETEEVPSDGLTVSVSTCPCCGRENFHSSEGSAQTQSGDSGVAVGQSNSNESERNSQNCETAKAKHQHHNNKPTIERHRHHRDSFRLPLTRRASKVCKKCGALKKIRSNHHYGGRRRSSSVDHSAFSDTTNSDRISSSYNPEGREIDYLGRYCRRCDHGRRSFRRPSQKRRRKTVDEEMFRRGDYLYPPSDSSREPIIPAFEDVFFLTEPYYHKHYRPPPAPLNDCDFFLPPGLLRRAPRMRYSLDGLNMTSGHPDPRRLSWLSDASCTCAWHTESQRRKVTFAEDFPGSNESPKGFMAGFRAGGKQEKEGTKTVPDNETEQSKMNEGNSSDSSQKKSAKPHSSPSTSSTSKLDVSIDTHIDDKEIDKPDVDLSPGAASRAQKDPVTISGLYSSYLWDMDSWEVFMKKALVRKRRRRAFYMGIIALGIVLLIGITVTVVFVSLRLRNTR